MTRTFISHIDFVNYILKKRKEDKEEWVVETCIVEDKEVILELLDVWLLTYDVDEEYFGNTGGVTVRQLQSQLARPFLLDYLD